MALLLWIAGDSLLCEHFAVRSLTCWVIQVLLAAEEDQTCWLHCFFITFCKHLSNSPLLFFGCQPLGPEKHRATKCCTQSVFSQDILTCRCDSFLMTWDIMTGCDWQIWLCGKIAHFCMDSRAWGTMRFCCNCQVTKSEFGSLLHIMSFPISHVNRRSWHVGNAYHFYWKYSNSQAVWLRYPLNCSVCLVYSPVYFEQFHFWFCRTNWQ